jgi:serine/threonine protein kinase
MKSRSQTPGDELPLALLKQVDQACASFEAAWQAAAAPAQRPQIETFLSAVPEPARPHLTLELAALESDLRRRAGEEPQPEHDTTLTDFLAPPQATDEVGRLGKYRILRILGHGGMGVVYLGDDPGLGRKVAVKAMLPDLARSQSSRQRFLREARAAAALAHDHIVPIFHVDEDRGAPYFVMPFLKGESLEQRLQPRRPLPLADILRIGGETARGLDTAHRAGLIHRDIKPANIWLETKDESGRMKDEKANSSGSFFIHHPSSFRIKILDFGLARPVSEGPGLTQEGVIVGTPAYMAPEQGRGETVDARCDLFSLGVVLYQVSTGVHPFKERDTISTLMAVAMHEPPPPVELNTAIPPALSDLVMKLLSKEPGRRIASAGEVVQALQTLEKELARQKLAEDSTDILDRADADHVRPSRSRRPVAVPALAVLGLIAVLGLLAAGIHYWQTKNDGPGNVGKDPPLNDPIGNVPVPPAGITAQKLQAEWAAKLKVPVESKSSTGIALILIPPGGAALPKPYFLGKYAVTQGEWEAVMGHNPSAFQKGRKIDQGLDTSRFPVEKLTWFDCVDYCNNLSAKEVLKPYYELLVLKRTKDGNSIDEAQVKILGGNGYRIPTDAEWGHACRAGTKTTYHFGDDDEELGDYAWYDKNSEKRTHPVGEKKPNAFGLYDMHGNVAQWNDNTPTNPMGEAQEHVLRGGSWLSPAANAAVGRRFRAGPAHRWNNTGLRLARAVSAEGGK